MQIVDYDKFLQFYLENKEKIFMQSGTKSINNNNVNKWFKNIQLYSPEEIKETYEFFAKTFIEFLLYVPFDEFYNIINKMSLQFNEIITSEEYVNIYIFIPDSVNKSNMWVALLFLDCVMKNEILTSEMKSKIKIVNNYNTLINNSNNNKSLCLYCDDMSYTGRQIYMNFLKKNNQSDSNIDKYIMISYISNVAREKLSLMSNIHFFKDTITVDSYINQLKQKYMVSNEETVNNVLKMFNYKTDDRFFIMGRKACNCNSLYTPIYFDHKIADDLSTFNKLLFTGSYPIEPSSSICEINPLIHGCDNIAELQELFTKNPCINNYTLDSEVPCFSSFYKTITYTINNNVIDNDKNIVYLLDNLKGGKRKKSKTKLIKKKKTNKKYKFSKNKSYKLKSRRK
jgi:hypothetical protein